VSVLIYPRWIAEIGCAIISWASGLLITISSGHRLGSHIHESPNHPITNHSDRIRTSCQVWSNLWQLLRSCFMMLKMHLNRAIRIGLSLFSQLYSALFSSPCFQTFEITNPVIETVKTSQIAINSNSTWISSVACLLGDGRHTTNKLLPYLPPSLYSLLSLRRKG